MRRQILKRLEALERAADTEVFAHAFVYPIAYYLGGAKHVSEVPDAFARALGYHDLEESCRAFVALYSWTRPSDMRERAAQAQSKLFARFGYDLRPTPIVGVAYMAAPISGQAAFADAAYRIVATLPDEWRAAIKSAHRKGLEAEAEADQILKHLAELVDQI